MNIKQSLSSLGFGLLLLAAMACTNENEQIGPNIPDPGTDDPNRREVLLTLKNDLRLTPVGTKAAGDPIATDDENYIQSLDVYVFGSKAENDPAHPYTFQELHYYRDDAAELPANALVKSFPFNVTNTTGSATALLKLNKGLFVKLYVVANRTQVYQTSADGMTLTEFTAFQSLLQDKPGQADNTIVPGKPTLADFLKFHTQRINPANVTNPTADDILITPLPMTGAYTTPLDLTDFGTSARTQISFKLSRMVARFDIVNEAAKSRFTVEKISMGGGRSGAGFFPIEVLPQEKTDLISYPVRPLSALTQQKKDDAAVPATTDLSRGAFYTWPSPTEDEGYLILKGKYAVNMTDVKEVSYRIPFQQVVNGVGSYIEVAYNHRYTIAITKADEYHLDFTLVVEDWDDTETGMEYDPENDFDKGTNIVLEDATSVGAYVLDNGYVELLPAADSKLAFTMGSNTKLKEELFYQEGSAEWVKIEEARITRATSMDSLYTYVIDEAALDDRSRLLPVTIRLTNPASGMRKEIKVVVPEGPLISWTPGTDAADKYSMFDVATRTATIYNVAGQAIKLQVAASTRAIDEVETTGSTATVADNWLISSDPAIATAQGDYTLTLDAAQDLSTVTATTATFSSVASGATTPVTVKLKDPKMPALEASDFVILNGTFDNDLDMAGGPKVTLFGLKDNLFTLTVTSPIGVDATTTGGDSWLATTQSAGQTGPDGQKTTVITGQIIDDSDMHGSSKTDGKITIANKLDPTDTYEVIVVTKETGSPEMSMKVVAGNLSTLRSTMATAGAPALTLVNLVGQTATVVTDRPTTVSMDNTDYVTVTNGDTPALEHVFTLNSTATLGNSTPEQIGSMEFTNDFGYRSPAYIFLENPDITALETTDLVSSNGENVLAVASDPDPAKVTMTEATAVSAFTLKVKSKAGIHISPETSAWLTVTITDEKEIATDVSSRKEATVTVAIAAGTDLTTAITDGQIVFTNEMPEGGDLTIDVVTTVVAPAP